MIFTMATRGNGSSSSSSSNTPLRKKRIALIGVGGASNSGKTTVSKHLRRLLTNSTIIHLDDFAPPQDQIPYSSQNPDLQDWDTPATAIDWPLLRSSLAYFKQHGSLPEAHLTHDHLNVLDGVPVPDEVDREARRLIAKVEQAASDRDEDLQFGILDGFLNFYNPEVLAQLDVRIFLRVPYATLKRRRETRNEYVTQSGDIWRDPPNYFDQIVYPAYVLAHAAIFSDLTPTSSDFDPISAAERVENATPRKEWSDPISQGGKGLKIVPVTEGSDGMGKALLEAMQAIARSFGRSAEPQ